MMTSLSTRIVSGLKRRAVHFREERGGVAAIEFCFIAPLMITVWLGTMEISQGIEMNKKVGRSSSIVADLVTQEDNVSLANLEDIMRIGAAVIRPYNRDDAIVTVSAIHIDASLNPTIVWSRKSDGETYTRPFAPGSATSVPANLRIADTNLVRVTTDINYIPITSWSIERNETGPDGPYASVPMSETYYLRPRVAEDVTCTGC